MSEQKTGQPEIFRLRAIDQEAYDELAGRLQRLIDDARAVADDLAGAVEQGRRITDEAAATAGRLEQRLRVGAHVLRASQEQVRRLEALTTTAGPTEHEAPQPSAEPGGPAADDRRGTSTQDRTPGAPAPDQAATAEQNRHRDESGKPEPDVTEGPELHRDLERMQQTARQLEARVEALTLENLRLRKASPPDAKPPDGKPPDGKPPDGKPPDDPPGVPPLLTAICGDLRTTIDDLLGRTSRLGATRLNGAQQELLGAARHDADRLLSLVDAALDCALIDASALAGREEAFDPGRLVSEVVEILAPRAADRSVALESIVDDDVAPRFCGDAGRLRRIVLLIAGTAVDLAQSGTVTLAVRPEHALGSGHGVRFEIRHEGAGVPESVLERLSSAEFRSQPAELTGPGGSGAALLLARRLVEALDGRFEIDSEPDRRLALSCAVPVSEATAAGSEQRTSGRLRQELLRCNLGEVLDLSRGGMRVSSARVPEDEVEVVIDDEGEPISLRARVAWSQKTGFRRHELGLQFVDLPQETAQRLTTLARSHSIQRTIDAG